MAPRCLATLLLPECEKQDVFSNIWSIKDKYTLTQKEDQNGADDHVPRTVEPADKQNNDAVFHAQDS